VKLTPTPLTAAIAGVFAGAVMPMLWSRLASDGTSLVIAFLLVVALPAHAFVAGFDRGQAIYNGTLDTALLKRIGTWFISAVLTTIIVRAFSA
jgi:hypothetical protein